MIFKKPKNALEGQPKTERNPNDAAEETFAACPKCGKQVNGNDLGANLNVCPYCRYHFRINARRRIELICDGGSFTETDAGLASDNILNFPGYTKKMANARGDSNETEAVVCGTCAIGGVQAALFVMEPYFMMGSMGAAVGEKITRLFERAADERLPVVGFAVSGGARMQEGAVSLMQMAKISGAVKRFSNGGNFYLAVLTDPTTGGVTASFAMQADIIVAEPFALIGFAGPRVIEQTMRKKLPDNFQRAEFVLEKGFLDDIVDRRKQKSYIAFMLRMHADRGASA